MANFYLYSHWQVVKAIKSKAKNHKILLKQFCIYSNFIIKSSKINIYSKSGLVTLPILNIVAQVFLRQKQYSPRKNNGSGKDKFCCC